MARYRKKPVEIEAIQFLPALTMDELYEWAGIDRKQDEACPHGFVHFTAEDGGIRIQTLEGPLRASPGDWIIKGIRGEFYPCKPDIFAATYELVSPVGKWADESAEREYAAGLAESDGPPDAPDGD